MAIHESLGERHRLEAIGEPTPEETATEVIRAHAGREALSESNPNSRFVRLWRPKGYTIDFDKVYYPPTEDHPPAAEITWAFNHILGEANLEILVDRLARSKNVQAAVNVIINGGKVALIGAHRERIDTLIMLASFQVAAERIAPGNLATLI